MKKTTLIIFILILIGFSFIYRNKLSDTEVSKEIKTETEREENGTNIFDPKNLSFIIEGEKVTLVNGISEKYIAPNSVSKKTTRYFGNEAYGDLNFDGIDDMVFLVTQDSGGSGTYYYAVAIINKDNRAKATNAFFIGDRIAPQSTFIPKNSGEIQINYAERRKEEPMSAIPTEAVTLLLKVTDDNVLEGLMK